MQRSIQLFSSLLVNIFNVITKSSCLAFYGEPDFPEELLK